MKSIVTLVALVIMASPSFAATTKKTNKTATKTTTVSNPETTSNTNSYTNTSSSKGPINWQAGLGLGTAGSQFHFGALAHGLYEISKVEFGEILIGGQTGFLFGPGTVSTWIIPVMAEGQINFKPTGSITPYAGLSMGIGIFHSSISFNNPLFTTQSVSNTDVDFAMLAKGGVFFGEEGKYYAELPLGTMGSAFAILPTFGMKF